MIEGPDGLADLLDRVAFAVHRLQVPLPASAAAYVSAR
jgi:hypothetical protein